MHAPTPVASISLYKVERLRVVDDIGNALKDDASALHQPTTSKYGMQGFAAQIGKA